MLVFPNGTHVKGEGARAGGFTKSRLSTEGHFLRSDSGRWLWSLEFACAFFFPPGGWGEMVQICLKSTGRTSHSFMDYRFDLAWHLYFYIYIIFVTPRGHAIVFGSQGLPGHNQCLFNKHDMRWVPAEVKPHTPLRRVKFVSILTRRDRSAVLKLCGQ